MVFTLKSCVRSGYAPRKNRYHSPFPKALLLSGVSALALSACGGGGSGGGSNVSNSPPTVTAIASQTIDEDSSTAPLPFTIGDAETPPASLVVSASSDNPTLIPNTNLTLAGSGASRTVQASPEPDGNGTAIITLHVDDGADVTTITFSVNINPLNDVPSITDIPDQVVDEDTSTGPLAFTISDVETPPDSLVITATSSDQALVPNANLLLSGSGINRTISLTPAPDTNGGPVTITLNVSDGSATTSMPFNVTITAQNDTPTASAIADQTIAEDTGTGLLAFTVGDVETPAGSLLVTAISSNSTLIPNANLVLGGSGVNRTIGVTPAPDLNGGPVTITVNVSDGSATTPMTFDVTITQQNDAPTVTAIADQTIDEDTGTGSLAFTVGDVETPAGSLAVTATSSNPTLIPNASLVLGGSGANRTIGVTPVPDLNGGPVTITVNVSDGSTTTATTFGVTVTPQNDPPTAVDDGFAVDQGAVNVPLDVLGNDVDPDLPADTLTIIATGTPSAGGTINNIGSQILYTPASGFSGTETFTYTIEDAAMISSMATVAVVVSSNGFIHYWKLDEASAPYSDTIDSAPATCTICPASAAGLIGSAQNFDGVSDELSVVSTASINWNASQSFGIESWVQKSTACVGDDAIAGRSDSQTQLKWWVGCNGAGVAVFELFDETGSGQRLTAVTNIADGQWHHIAAIRDAGTGQNRLYIDGTLEASANIVYTAGFTSQSADLTVGWLDNTTTDYYFGGIVDELAIHAGVLSDAAISQHFMDGSVGLRRGYQGCTGPVRIMPLGDSITRRVGYRPGLYFDLVGADYDVDFVGSVADSSGTYDRDHEGHAGFTTSDIAAQLNSWLALNPPDVILLHIGTNEDPSFPYPSETKVEDLLNIIDGFDPGITVLLARIINKVPNELLVTQFNDNVEAMALVRVSSGDKILVVDHESALNYVDDMDPDGIHPNTAGFSKMVPVWSNGLASFLPVCPP